VAEGYWHRSYLSVTVNGMLDGGTLPKTPAGGIGASVGPTWVAPGWRLRVLASAEFFPPQRATTSFTDGNFSLMAVSGRGCLTAEGNLFEIGFCVGAELAAMHVSGAPPSALGDRSMANSTQYWPAPEASVLATWRLSTRVSLFGRSDVVVPSTRRNFHSAVGNDDPYTVPALATRGALGIELRFF
jgi:hypothetical protein